MAIQNEKGDTIRIAEIRLRPKQLANPENGFNCTVASKCIDSRDGSEYYDSPVDRNIDLDAHVAKGTITAEEFQQVYTVIARVYEADRTATAEVSEDEPVSGGTIVEGVV